MKLKNKDVLNFVNGCASLREKRLPVKLGYAIKKNLAAVIHELQSMALSHDLIGALAELGFE